MPIYKYKNEILKSPNEETDLPEFQKAIETSMMNPVYKAYAILLYWLGCRRSEPLFILKENIEETEDALYIDITVNPDVPYSRLKDGLAAGPVEVPLNLYGVTLVRDVWRFTSKGARIFRFSDKTGYRIIKRLLPGKSPHWLRHNRITKLRKKRDRGEITTDNIKSFTGIRRDSTIERYGMKTEKGIHKVAQVLD